MLIKFYSNKICVQLTTKYSEKNFQSEILIKRIDQILY